MEIRTFLFFYNANGNDLADKQKESYVADIDDEFIWLLKTYFHILNIIRFFS